MGSYINLAHTTMESDLPSCQTTCPRNLVAALNIAKMDLISYLWDLAPDLRTQFFLILAGVNVPMIYHSSAGQATPSVPLAALYTC